MEKKYQGVIIDQMGTLDTRKTKPYSTYKEAYDATERLCRKSMGDRGTLEVQEVGIYCFTETNLMPGAKPEVMVIKFESKDGGNHVVIKSSDYAKMVKKFTGIDGIVYAQSELFDNYDFEIDDGEQVVFVSR